jgi:hypothetical protein
MRQAYSMEKVSLASDPSENGFDFVLIGGLAASAYGSTYVTHSNMKLCLTWQEINLLISMMES